jgi:DNA polymerase (family 10)
MDNYYIADQFSMLAKLLDIHGEQSFKAKSYSIASFNIEKLPVQLTDLPPEKISSLQGIGDSTAKKILEIIRTGTMKALQDYILKTPPGVIEMLSIKGLGPKKIATIWKEMEIETPGELLYACNENRLLRFKGFGAKTQDSIRQAITFYLQNQGRYLFASIEKYAHQIDGVIKKAFPKEAFELTGQLKMQSLIVDKLEWVTTTPVNDLHEFFSNNNYTVEEVQSGSCSFSTPENVMLQFYSRTKNVFYSTLFETSCSEAFLQKWNETISQDSAAFKSEEDVFQSRDLNFIPAFLREKPYIIQQASKRKFNDLIQPEHIKGIIHSHSTWSDGSNTIEEMAQACIKKGYEYLVISDHSKTAAYANGLQEERIIEQHKQIDELNKKLVPFRIFKSIESDILSDGALDYPDDMLSRFDLVIASIHSNLKMPEEKAMLRLLNAIRNPHTSILGHMTGRLLLSRPGYPVDYEKIINACAENNVAIEINANPRRLDMDWYWVDYALEKGVLVSIDPDAHDIAEYDNCRYGVLAAQKGGVTPKQNLSSFSLKDFEEWVGRREQRAGRREQR